jgi:hypothetical protein
MIANHQHVERPFSGELSGKASIVARDPDGTNAAILPQAKKLISNARREFVRLHDAEEVEDVDPVGPELS